MTSLVFYLLSFSVVGIVLLLRPPHDRKAIRPSKPDAEKLTIYECGEPTIGSAWIQFDLRYYVVALLFVIFDVEVAFFFPWAVVFGKCQYAGKPRTCDPTVRQVLSARLMPTGLPNADGTRRRDGKTMDIDADTAKSWAWIAFADILVFFGVLLVGFAYLWRRGDLDWVRSTAAERTSGTVEELRRQRWKAGNWSGPSTAAIL